ncbi:amidase [Sciscionella marina]|uniref:amidase n=1 Tax=Sciscionella marina TaxID=508770 RepID=UPI00035DE9BB|nr:amidase [Sciscionella marina]
MRTTIAEAAAALRSGATTAVELLRSRLTAADAHDTDLGVYLSRFDDTAFAAAARADAELATGQDRGPLHGIPFGVKDCIAAEEGTVTAQSTVPGAALRQDAPVVARLRAAGAVLTGKTTMMEFAIGAPDPDAPFPLPRNPWHTAHYTGGSTSGSASGIAAGMFLGGLGTDTAGSIRYPAAACGVTGLKPTFGLVPKSGCIPLGDSHDHVGPLAATAWDCAMILSVIAGSAPDDPSSTGRGFTARAGHRGRPLAGQRIGLTRLPGGNPDVCPELGPALDAAVTELRACGAEVVPVELPWYEELTWVARLGLAAEAFAYHATGLREHWLEYGPGTRMAIVRGSLISAGDFVQLQRVRRAGQRKLAELFTGVDLVVTPTSTHGAPEFRRLCTDGMAETAFTAYWNAVGNPAVSVPMGFTAEGLPLGMQIAGRPFEDAGVLAAADAYQSRTDWHRRSPALSVAAVEESSR